MRDSFTFPKANHLKKSNEIKNLYNQGLKKRFDCYLVFFIPNNMDISRLALSIPKRMGNAVKRNREKRLLREYFRHNKHLLNKGLDILFVVISKLDNINDRNKALGSVYEWLKTSANS